jgi:hypothetical protein
MLESLETCLPLSQQRATANISTFSSLLSAIPSIIIRPRVLVLIAHLYTHCTSSFSSYILDLIFIFILILNQNLHILEFLAVLGIQGHPDNIQAPSRLRLQGFQIPGFQGFPRSPSPGPDPDYCTLSPLECIPLLIQAMLQRIFSAFNEEVAPRVFFISCSLQSQRALHSSTKVKSYKPFLVKDRSESWVLA